MKTWLLNIILCLSFGIIVLVYYQKDTHKQDHIDYMSQSLESLKKILPPAARLNYRGISSDPVNNWETYLIPRYILVPAVLGTNLPTDSMLLVFRLDTDTPGRYIDSTTNIIWENKDSTYHYYFIKR